MTGTSAVVLLIGIARAAEPVDFAHFEAPIMHTRIEVWLPADARSARDAAEVFGTFRRVEALANEWRSGSPLARVNQAHGQPVEVPGELEALLRRGLEIGALTGGAFDITWASLWGLWDWDRPALPDPSAVREAAARVDYRRVGVASGEVTLPDGMCIGLGGIAKGWALDSAALGLEHAGREDFLLSAGGQVLARGTRRGVPWRVGVRDPWGSESFVSLEVGNVSVSTSGDYERGFVLDGVRYHHILDPKTGWPATALRSATVIAPEATLADALSTALMVMGPGPASVLLAELPGVEAVLVGPGGEMYATAGAPLLAARRPGAPAGVSGL